MRVSELFPFSGGRDLGQIFESRDDCFDQLKQFGLNLIDRFRG